MVRRMRASVGVELALGVVVLALAAVLVATAPARTTYVTTVNHAVGAPPAATQGEDLRSLLPRLLVTWSPASLLRAGRCRASRRAAADKPYYSA